MEIETRDYGAVEVKDASIIQFDEGIIGFEPYHRYVLLDDGNEPSPFRCLQSVDESGLAFILLDPFSVKPDYEINIDDEAAVKLAFDGDEEVVILAIVVVPEDIKRMSFNLKAPIIINAHTHKGLQYIVDRSDYGVRHYVFDEIERAKGMGTSAESNIGVREGITAV